MKRIISATVLVIAVSLALFSYWVSGIVIVILSILGLYEFFRMVEKKNIRPYKYFGLAIGSIIPLSILFRFELTRNWEFLFIVCALTGLILLQFSRRQNLGAIVDVSTTIFGILYVSWFFSFLIKIRELPQGAGLLASVIIITKLGDMGAYLIGRQLGKTLMIPRVSPNKTWEGAFGGLVFSVLAALSCGGFLKFSFARLAALGVFLGIIGQLGDLSESLFKRDCQIKDSGSVFPGMGGVLDLIDSLLFSAPVFYLYMVIKII